MSVFTSLVTQVVAIPHDAGQTATIRKLAPKHLEAAAKAAQLRAIEDFRAMGAAQFLKELQAVGGEQAATSAAATDPLLKFDRLTLLEHGVTGWTYTQSCTRASFEDLDEETLDCLSRAVLRLAKPSLFETDVEREAARKNG